MWFNDERHIMARTSSELKSFNGGSVAWCRATPKVKEQLTKTWGERLGLKQDDGDGGVNEILASR